MATRILANLWISNLTNQKNPPTVQNGFMRGLGDYITSNVKFNIMFTGTSPMGAPVSGPDIMNLNGSPTSAQFPIFRIPPKDGNGCYMDGAPEWLDWMTQVYSGINLSLIQNGSVCLPTPPLPAFILTTPTWTRNELKATHESNLDNPQHPIMDKIAECIMRDMQSFHILSFPATYGSAVGVATVTSVILP